MRPEIWEASDDPVRNGQKRNSVRLDSRLRSDVQSIVGAIVDAVQADRNRLMDIVQAVQQRVGYLSDEAIHAIASRLGIHGVEVEDMASFYAFLNREPKGRFHIRLSKTPISMMKGATALARGFLGGYWGHDRRHVPGR